MPPTSQCAVIRCARPASAVRVMSLPGRMLIETAVCTEHDTAMTAGEPWYYNSADDRSVIYMGDDLKAEGVRRLAHQRFKITHRGPGGDDETLHLLLTRAEALSLADWLQRWAPPDSTT